ncbi:MAG: hypothetical protein WCJ53_00065 [Mycobacteriaceae bacterium]
MRSPMNLTRLAAASVFLAGGIGVGLATPANADPDPLGSYTFEGEDGEMANWALMPCAEPADNCVQVSETGNSKRAPWTGTAYTSVGSWIMFVNQPDAILCGDGTSVPGVNNYSWNASGLAGYASINTGGACGKEAESLAIPFQLSKVGGPILYPTAPIYDAPVVPLPAETPAAPSTASAPAESTPVENDPAIVATPSIIAPPPFELTEAEVALPGFNR